VQTGLKGTISMSPGRPYPISISDRLEKLQQRVKRRVIEKGLGEG
jgi:hypothetical protein